MPMPRTDKPRGILNPHARPEQVRHARFLPAPELAEWIEHYWLVVWDLEGRPPVVGETLSHPTIHVVFERGASSVVGVPRGRFSRKMEGRGWVVGLKFRPGAFAPLAGGPVARLTDRTLPVREVLGIDPGPIEAELAACPDDAGRAAVAERVARTLVAPLSPEARQAGRIVERIRDDRALLRVEEVAAIEGLKERALQRLFHRCVGVTPKWVIRRYRLHEAAEQLVSGRVRSWPRLALDLGYFDQAHFIRDFKAVVGATPAEYARRAGVTR